MASTTIKTLQDIIDLERLPIGDVVPGTTIYGKLLEGSHAHADKPAIVYLSNGRAGDLPEEISFLELIERVNQCANMLAESGVGPDDAVAILLPNVPEAFVSLIGATVAGIAFPINWMLKEDEIAALLETAGVRHMIALGPDDELDIYERASRIKAKAKCLDRIFWVGSEDRLPSGGASFRQLCASHSTVLGDQFHQDPQDCALFIATGGTTGAPKIAKLSHYAVVYKIWAYTTLLGYGPHLCGVTGLPQFHVGGLIAHTILYLSNGMKNVVLGPLGFRKKDCIHDFWKIVERYGITELGGVPSSLATLATVPVDGDISTLRSFCLTGSTALPKKVSQFFEDQLGIRLLVTYGMTEYTATAALPPPGAEDRGPTSGFRLPYTEIRVVALGDQADEFRECAPDEDGEIQVRGPGLFLGFIGPQPAPVTDDGWLQTGDIGCLDPDGYIRITGRIKDLIIRGGNNIDPSVIEATLNKHPDVLAAAAVGRPDSYAGELPVAYVQLKPGHRITPDELLAYARQNIPERPAAPAKIYIRESLPLTAVGKIFKPSLRAHAAHEVFDELAKSICPGGVAVEITEPKQGRSTAIFKLEPSDNTDVDSLTRRLRSAMDAYTFPYEVMQEAVARSQVDTSRS